MFKFKNSDLSSRQLGVQERKRLIQQINNKSVVTIDLSNVFFMSESFSDECFGILVLKYGYDQLSSKIHFKNANPSVKKSIASSILRRKKEL